MNLYKKLMNLFLMEIIIYCQRNTNYSNGDLIEKMIKNQIQILNMISITHYMIMMVLK